MTDAFLNKLKLARSVQQNVPYGSSLMRSGEMRFNPSLSGGFNPAFLLPFMPLAKQALERPVKKISDKLWDFLGLGRGGALFRSGGFWNKPGDIGMAVPSIHNANNAAMGAGMGPGALSNRDIKNLKVLESKLSPLANDPTAFMNKLMKIHAKGEGYFKKHRKAMKGGKAKKYKLSKRYKALKAKFYAKFPKATHGKYHGSAKYKSHKAKYVAHHAKKKRS